MGELVVIATRGGREESLHRVSCAVVDAEVGLVAQAGDATRFTWWRSAAKPFQAMALVEDGGADQFGLGPEELALTCASHSSEPGHLAVVDRFLDRIGATEADLRCGPHPPLSAAVQRTLIARGQDPTPRWSNCSGKHAGMLALARVHGWPTTEYTEAGHPVQQRLLRSIVEWTGVPAGAVALGVDGCTTVCYGLPLRAMATAWARFGSSTESAPHRLRTAMLAHPFLVAGTGRPCTQIMAAWPGEVIAKIGADGVYCAAIPGRGLGVAIKVEDGDMRASALVMVAVIRELLRQVGESESTALEHRLAGLIAPEIRNTRGEPTGRLEVSGTLVFLEPGVANG